MTSCSAPDCTNTLAEGFSMKKFPTNEKFKEKWVESIRRICKIEDWTPPRHPHLCEVHFASNMWEFYRFDGLIRLRKFSVPTIFKSHSSEKTDIQEIESSMDTEDDNSSLKVPIPTTSRTDTQDLKVMKRKYNNLEKKFKALQSKNQVLLDVLRTDKYRAALYRVFTDDQIKCLLNSKRIPRWSSASIGRAVRLRDLCGVHGYEELRKQGIPLPCLRILNKLELKFFEAIKTSIPQPDPAQQIHWKPEPNPKPKSEPAPPKDMISIIKDEWD